MKGATFRLTEEDRTRLFLQELIAHAKTRGKAPAEYALEDWRSFARFVFEISAEILERRVNERFAPVEPKRKGRPTKPRSGLALVKIEPPPPRPRGHPSPQGYRNFVPQVEVWREHLSQTSKRPVSIRAAVKAMVRAMVDEGLPAREMNRYVNGIAKEVSRLSKQKLVAK